MQQIKINIKNAKFENGFNVENGTDKRFLKKKEEVYSYIEDQKDCDYAVVVVEDETHQFSFN